MVQTFTTISELPLQYIYNALDPPKISRNVPFNKNFAAQAGKDF
jgi:hypothetical protein